jgi:hypothetical protein
MIISLFELKRLLGLIHASSVIDDVPLKSNDDSLAISTKSSVPSNFNLCGLAKLPVPSQPDIELPVGSVKLFNVPLSSGDAKSTHVVVVVEFVAIPPSPSKFSASTLSSKFVRTIAPEELLEEELDEELELLDELEEELDEELELLDELEDELDEELELLEELEEELELLDELEDELLLEDELELLELEELVEVGQLTVVLVMLLVLFEEFGSVVVVVAVA